MHHERIGLRITREATRQSKQDILTTTNKVVRLVWALVPTMAASALMVVGWRKSGTKDKQGAIRAAVSVAYVWIVDGLYLI